MTDSAWNAFSEMYNIVSSEENGVYTLYGNKIIWFDGDLLHIVVQYDQQFMDSILYGFSEYVIDDFGNLSLVQTVLPFFSSARERDIYFRCVAGNFMRSNSGIADDFHYYIVGYFQ